MWLVDLVNSIEKKKKELHTQYLMYACFISRSIDFYFDVITHPIWFGYIVLLPSKEFLNFLFFLVPAKKNNAALLNAICILGKYSYIHCEQKFPILISRRHSQDENDTHTHTRDDDESS